MSEPEPVKQFILPENLITPVDLSRTVRELSALDESLYQANIRTPGQPVKLARSSRILEDLATANNVSLLDTLGRAELLEALKTFVNQAPRVHISFATEPSARFNGRIIVWLRQNIHPQILLEIGLQPMLAVGCMVRTPNKVFDMSLRHRFKEQRHSLRDSIAGLKNNKPAAGDNPAPLTSEVSAP